MVAGSFAPDRCSVTRAVTFADKCFGFFMSGVDSFLVGVEIVTESSLMFAYDIELLSEDADTLEKSNAGAFLVTVDILIVDKSFL